MRLKEVEKDGGGGGAVRTVSLAVHSARPDGALSVSALSALLSLQWALTRSTSHVWLRPPLSFSPTSWTEDKRSGGLEIIRASYWDKYSAGTRFELIVTGWDSFKLVSEPKLDQSWLVFFVSQNKILFQMMKCLVWLVWCTLYSLLVVFNI